MDAVRREREKERERDDDDDDAEGENKDFGPREVKAETKERKMLLGENRLMLTTSTFQRS